MTEFSHDINCAIEYDRFTVDVNLLLKRYRREHPKLQKEKIISEDTLSKVSYVFFLLDRDGKKQYVTQHTR